MWGLFHTPYNPCTTDPRGNTSVPISRCNTSKMLSYYLCHMDTYPVTVFPGTGLFEEIFC